MRRLSRLALVWTLALASAASNDPLAYAGFSRNMDLSVLLERYPRSSHELSPSGDVRRRTSQDDFKEWVREFFRTRGSGTYVVRLTPTESPDHVFYVQAEVRQGITERLWLLLERPLDGITSRGPRASNETRYPPCNELLTSLTAEYGKPEAIAPRQEEALETFDYVWNDTPEEMKLQCGRYAGRKSVFAISVTLEKAVP